VKAYEDGQTVYALADQFGIHRTTVSAHLHRHGISLRCQGLSPDDVILAHRLLRRRLVAGPNWWSAEC
jgi:hypothetical protein